MAIVSFFCEMASPSGMSRGTESKALLVGAKIVMLLADTRVSAMLGTRARSSARVDRSSWDAIMLARSLWATAAVARAARLRNFILKMMILVVMFTKRLERPLKLR